MDYILVYLYVYAFILGMCIASFINVVIFRVPLGISVAKGRSYCPNCQHSLSALDLMPIVSYLALGGKCRYCKSKIPVRDTLLEALGGCLAMLCFHLYGFDWMTILSFAYAMVLVAVAMIDFDTMIIPDRLNLSILIIALLSLFVSDISILDRVIGLLAVSLPMYLLNLFITDAFGGGDIKLLAASGLLLGWRSLLVGTFIALLIAGSYACYLLITKKADTGTHIAFGPYLCVGLFIAMLYGDSILRAYLGLFGL